MSGPIRAEQSARLTHRSRRLRPNPAHVIFCVQAVMSPLLSNLVLDELDRELERRGHRLVRYADDCNI